MAAGLQELDHLLACLRLCACQARAHLPVEQIEGQEADQEQEQ